MALGTPADLAAARAKLITDTGKGILDTATRIKYLRLVRDLGVHDAEGVCEYGSYVLAKGARQLGSVECAIRRA
jgi:hypothetical protein